MQIWRCVCWLHGPRSVWSHERSRRWLLLLLLCSRILGLRSILQHAAACPCPSIPGRCESSPSCRIRLKVHCNARSLAQLEAFYQKLKSLALKPVSTGALYTKVLLLRKYFTCFLQPFERDLFYTKCFYTRGPTFQNHKEYASTRSKSLPVRHCVLCLEKIQHFVLQQNFLQK